MAKQPDITHELLRQLVRFEADIQKYFWNPRPRKMFKTDGSFKSWNSAWANKETFHAVDGRGYCQAVVLYRHYNAHRIIWFYHYGEWPNGQVDHINGIRTDNRLANLRVVSQAENLRNTKRRVNNSSGTSGVSWNPLTKTWRVRVPNKEIGSFQKKQDAVAARKAAEVEYGFHPNHGRS